MTYPESMAAANAVLRAAEAWVDAERAVPELNGDLVRADDAFIAELLDASEVALTCRHRLYELVDAYRATGRFTQVTDAKEAGD